MSRIAGRFQQLAEQGRKAVVPYIVVGDPGPQVTVPLMHGLVESGADIIELGVPFSDPMSEGPVIQLAHEPPSHIIMPAIHKSASDVAELFHQHFPELNLAGTFKLVNVNSAWQVITLNPELVCALFLIFPHDTTG